MPALKTRIKLLESKQPMIADNFTAVFFSGRPPNEGDKPPVTHVSFKDEMLERLAGESVLELRKRAIIQFKGLYPDMRGGCFFEGCNEIVKPN